MLYFISFIHTFIINTDIRIITLKVATNKNDVICQRLVKEKMFLRSIEEGAKDK